MTAFDTRSQRTPEREVPIWIIAGLGIIFSAVGISYLVAHPDPPVPWTLEFVLGIVPSLGLVYAGYWMTTSERAFSDERELVRACLIGGFTVGVVALGYVIHEVFTGQPQSSLFLLVSTSIATGGVVGLALALIQLPFDRSPLNVATPGNRQREPDDTTEPSDQLSPTARALAAVLSDRYRWTVVEALHRSETPVAITALEQELETQTEMPASRVRVKLRHGTLPALDAKGLIVVDTCTGTVDSGDELEEVVDAAEELRTALDSLERGSPQS